MRSNSALSFLLRLAAFVFVAGGAADSAADYASPPSEQLGSQLQDTGQNTVTKVARDTDGDGVPDGADACLRLKACDRATLRRMVGRQATDTNAKRGIARGREERRSMRA
jgi:hypothetical protein